MSGRARAKAHRASVPNADLAGAATRAEGGAVVGEDLANEAGKAAEKPRASDDQKLYRKLSHEQDSLEMKKAGTDKRAATTRRSMPADTESFQ